MRRLQIAAKDVIAIHRASHGDLAEGDGGSGRYGSVVTGEAEIAIGAHDGLDAAIFLGRTVVQGVALSREFLVPQGQLASEANVRLVAIHAEVGTGAGDGRFAPRTKIVHSDDVA